MVLAFIEGPIFLLFFCSLNSIGVFLLSLLHLNYHTDVIPINDWNQIPNCPGWYTTDSNMTITSLFPNNLMHYWYWPINHVHHHQPSHLIHPIGY